MALTKLLSDLCCFPLLDTYVSAHGCKNTGHRDIRAFHTSDVSLLSQRCKSICTGAWI